MPKQKRADQNNSNAGASKRSCEVGKCSCIARPKQSDLAVNQDGVGQTQTEQGKTQHRRVVPGKQWQASEDSRWKGVAARGFRHRDRVSAQVRAGQIETEGDRGRERERNSPPPQDCLHLRLPCVVLDRVAGCPKLSDPPWSLQGGSESFGTRAQAVSGHG